MALMNSLVINELNMPIINLLPLLLYHVKILIKVDVLGLLQKLFFFINIFYLKVVENCIL